MNSKLIALILILFFLIACTETVNETDFGISRESSIPVNAVKMTPETDLFPPIMHSNEFFEPEPLSFEINSRGAEDSAFILPDGKTIYFFFTPDVSVPVEKQVLDKVTGIYVSYKKENIWSNPERIMLQDKGKLALDGCEFIQENKIWFCSAREGFTGMNWFTAELIDEKWINWKNADFNPEFKVGELHFSADGQKLFFHSSRKGGKGQYDLWVSRKQNNEWLEPENLSALNSSESEGWPFLTYDEKELWFTRFYKGSPAIFRSKKINNEWSEPELIISQFAGEPSLDNKGNIYFTHHFYNKKSEMIEADIYIARKE
jgi:hypothetical protein